VHDNGLADPAEAMAGNLHQIPSYGFRFWKTGCIQQSSQFTRRATCARAGSNAIRCYHASYFINTSVSRSRVATVAALLTATSATVMAAYHQSDDNGSSINDRNWGLKSTNNMYIADCESQKTDQASETLEFLPETILKFDHYNGVIIHLDWIFNQTVVEDGETEKQQQLKRLYKEWKENPRSFEDLLQRSLQNWKNEGRKGIWIHLPREMASVVPVSSCIPF
jgi:hypothetical protein